MEELKQQYEELLDRFVRLHTVANKAGLLELGNNDNLNKQLVAERDILEYGAFLLVDGDGEHVFNVLDNIIAQVTDQNDHTLATAKREAVSALNPNTALGITCALERINSHTPFPIKETLERFGLWDEQLNGI
jgi:flagellar motor component MotA